MPVGDPGKGPDCNEGAGGRRRTKGSRRRRRGRGEVFFVGVGFRFFWVWLVVGVGRRRGGHETGRGRHDRRSTRVLELRGSETGTGGGRGRVVRAPRRCRGRTVLGRGERPCGRTTVDSVWDEGGGRLWPEVDRRLRAHTSHTTPSWLVRFRLAEGGPLKCYGCRRSGS